MSFPFNARLWIATKEDIENVILKEKVLPKLGPIKDRSYAHRLIGNLLCRYIVLCNNLSELYDQTLQVQKRPLIEQLLMSCTNRYVELRTQMNKIEMSEFHYLDDALVELKLAPQKIEFLRPFYFPRKRSVEAQQIVDEVPKVSRESEFKEVLKGKDRFKIVLTPEQIEAKQQKELMENAVNLIKSHEKAKQARVHVLNVKLFPKMYKIEPADCHDVEYDFIHKQDQVPLFKIKRTHYNIDLYRPIIKRTKFAFYEPPQFRLNRLGQKVLVKQERPSVMSSGTADDAASDDIDFDLVKEEEDRLKALAEMESMRTEAAVKIQRFFRGYQLRKLIKRREWKRMELCGLVEKPEDHAMQKLKIANEIAMKKRRERKWEFDDRFLKAVNDEHARILKLKSDSIMEDISDDIRQWFREFYDQVQDFHRYPEQFEGGTILVVQGETMTPEEFLIDQKKTDAQRAKEKEELKKAKKDAAKKKKKEETAKKKLAASRKKQEQKEGPTWDYADEEFVSSFFGSLSNS